ncbi:hypothetical protein ACFWYW_27885 [Nonomuraea sp. NPDC059023]|uniref:hypothetical protein n=1 Tax=unclassified Nonomuraea TaxID=2593643 RepID=UPI00367F8C94
MYAPPGALDAVLALDKASMPAGSFRLNEVAAGVAHLVLTHLWPGHTDRPALEAAGAEFAGKVSVARAGLVLDL